MTRTMLQKNRSTYTYLVVFDENFSPNTDNKLYGTKRNQTFNSITKYVNELANFYQKRFVSGWIEVYNKTEGYMYALYF